MWKDPRHYISQSKATTSLSGTQTVPTGSSLSYSPRLTIEDDDRVTLKGTARITIYGQSGTPAVIYGVPRYPLSFTVPNDYDHTVAARLGILAYSRGTLTGSARVIVTDDFGTRSRVTLQGRG